LEILEKYEGRPSIERHASFLVQISHFDPVMASSFSYAEIAAAAILVASSDLADARQLPASLLTDRNAQAAAMLRQVSTQMGLELFQTTPGAPSPSRTAVDPSSATPSPPGRSVVAGVHS
jgi:hypothetical protein